MADKGTALKVISVFNNKGGVGKTTLTYHIGHCLSEMGFKVLLLDADPQCNLTIYSVKEEYIHTIWEEEDKFIDEGFDAQKKNLNKDKFERICSSPRSLHFLLKPAEEGTGELEFLPPPYKLTDSLDIIPGRLTLHLFEEKIASRWTDLYRGEPLALRTITKVREIAERYSDYHGYDFVIVDTSPSLGAMNKAVISTVDGFFIPALPDLFSLYGVKNIGKALSAWKEEFDVIYKLISKDKRKNFPERYVTFLGYTIYNAKKYANKKNEWGLAEAHHNYAKQIPKTIEENISKPLRSHLNSKQLRHPIGGVSIMHTHNTFPSMAQYYHVPMWKVPGLLPDNVEPEHKGTLTAASQKYIETKAGYEEFCRELIERINLLG